MIGPVGPVEPVVPSERSEPESPVGPASCRRFSTALCGTALAVLLVSPGLAPAATAPTVAVPADLEAAIREDVAFLASPDLAGRLVGSEGERRAAEFLAGELEALGARPLPGRDGYLLPFEFTAGVEDAGSSLTLSVAPADTPGAGAADAGPGAAPAEDSGDAGAGRTVFRGGERVRALSFSDSGEASGEVIFAGYGLVVPEGQDLPYDSYAGLDVEGKVVLVLRYFPEGAEPEVRQVLARYAGLRYKALHARQRGAKAVLVATGPSSPNAGETVPTGFDTAISGSGILAASVSGEVAQAMLSAAGKDLAAVQEALDGGNPHVAGFALPGVEATVAVEVERERKTGLNVVGYLPAPPVAPAPAEPWVVLGAHFDHLGTGGHGNSLARKGEEGTAHLGADDNASGAAAVLAAGRLLADAPDRRRHVVLAFWSGEEIGLLGSDAFVGEAVLPPGDVAAYLNFDMVGRLREERLTLQAVGTSPAWPGLVERANVPAGFDLVLQDDPWLPTDSASFHRADVPTLSFFTGSHEDYHRPSDTPDKLDVPGIARVARFAAAVTARLAAAEEPPEFVEVERAGPAGGNRATLRAFTGTIPDYATEVEGLRLSGVVGGGPAEEAGLREGDVIVELGGQSIANIYDYTYALEAVKIGAPVPVVYLRDGERRTATIVPRARD